VGVRVLWLALLCPTLALAADASGALRLSFNAGMDTNPGRDFGDVASADGAFSALGVAEGRVRGERWSLTGEYELGARAFATQRDANLWVQAGSASAAWAPGELWTVGVEGRAKDRHAGSRGRAYADLAGGPFLALFPSGSWDLELHAEARRFLLRDEPAYSFGAGMLTAVARYRLSRHHGFSGELHLSRERYAAWAVEPSGTPLDETREDTRTGGTVGYRYRGQIALAFAYGLDDVVSNSFGESQLRHRLTATAGVHLPLRLMLFVDLALQLTRYPDGVYLSPELLLLEDDENLSSAAARLVRPLGRHLDLELRYGLYQTRLPQNGLTYVRQQMSAGVTLRY
jgi:hypothetical protein